MTDRIRTLTVVLDQDLRADDAAEVVNALRMVRHVASVVPGRPVDTEALDARDAVRADVRRRLMQAIDDVLGGRT